MSEPNASHGLIDFTKHLRSLIERKLWLRVLIGMLLGIITGAILSPELGWLSNQTSHSITQWLALPGNLFIRLVQMIMIPLVLSFKKREITIYKGLGFLILSYTSLSALKS